MGNSMQSQACDPYELPAPLVPAAARGLAPRGPGRPGLLRRRQGGLACLASARDRGQEAGWT
jgi:hypothetical protein